MANMPTEGVLQQMLVQIEKDSNNEEEVSFLYKQALETAKKF